jgi:RNA polymerase sigma-70 factor (ECF subfamily)|tara:strand:+ start:13508 stop:14032 length:525 start_codon:yes stop_codon:yes gene_type:complete
MLNKETMLLSDTFGFQIHQHQSFLRSLALKLTHHSEDAEDLIQETFLKALKNENKFKEGTNLRGWLYTILRNTFINNYRKKRSQNTYTDDTENQFILGSITSDPETEADSSLNLNTILENIETIEKSYLEAFMMHFNGYKYDEIAEKMNIPLGTVKSRIFLARKKMVQRLKESH